MKNILQTFLAFALLLPGLPSSAADPGFKVVVNEANITNSITPEQLSRVFLKQVNWWVDGAATLPVDQVSKSKVREAFSKKILDRDVNAIKSHWQRQIFSGRGVPPPEKTSDAEVLEFVKTNPGAVGYVASSAALPTGVRELVVTE